MLYMPRGPQILSVYWVCTYRQALGNASWTQRFVGTFLQVPPKGYPISVLLDGSPTIHDAH